MSCKYQQKFPAVLRDSKNESIATGFASVSPEDQSIDFTSDFVPIYKMGTELSIIQTKDQYEVACYTGKVYLSATQLLRLVSVEQQVLPGACYAFLYPVELEGELTALLRDAKPRRFRPFRRQSAPETFPVSINAISMRQIRFQCAQKLDQTQLVTLNLAQPPVHNALLKIEHAVEFGEGAISYRCAFADIDGEATLRLEPFVRELTGKVSALRTDPPVTSASEQNP